jgi:biotin carboxylase
MQMQYIQDIGFFLKIQNFQKICQEHGIKFIELPEMIDRMGDKASAKATMIEAGVPVVPGSVSHSNKRKSWHDLLVTNA